MILTNFDAYNSNVNYFRYRILNQNGKRIAHCTPEFDIIPLVSFFTLA